MQCNSCSGEVPAKFSHAITQNVCPFCGEAIMEEELQKILSSLHNAMAAAVKLSYTTLALDWMSSNFNLVSRDDDEFLSLKTETEAARSDAKKTEQELEAAKKELEALKAGPKPFVKPTPKSGQAKAIQLGTDSEGHEVQLQGESIQDPNKTQQFLDRAQIKPTNNADHFKKMVKQIKKTGGSGGGGGDMDMMAQAANASPEEVEAMERALSGASSSLPMISSSVGSDMDYGDEALPPIAEAFAAAGAGQQSSTFNAKDVARLQALQQKSASKSNAMRTGGGVGLIRR